MTNFSNALIIGAPGGIGGAIADRLESQGMKVTRLSRSSKPPIDFADETGLAAAAEALRTKAPYDLVLLASGILHSDDFGPEKSWKMLEKSALEQVFLVNTIGPMLAARHFLPLMPRKGRSVFAALSARVGSITDNRLGGWYGYRASKAALNQFIRTLSIELGRTHEDLVALALHPGTVDTDLSEPFQGNVPDGKLFTPDYSAEKLIAVMREATSADSGKHIDWAGEEVHP
ncbi:MAG: SDR family NAD(P)-dependent oxidoreductase [Erythrobacter sp.]|nr:SDR family NAD(P)-dependent oxidoreductase [Erythrobacter sp.]NNC47231.1 SDR family NAD(P)-dependent oxidoreductase [Sphingomonas sp.]RZV52687.1 MAG: SDR family NAD(P)-dependent oxidoreductase [Sphingomonadaceae bacterium]